MNVGKFYTFASELARNLSATNEITARDLLGIKGHDAPNLHVNM